MAATFIKSASTANHSNPEAGFTLVELLVGMVVTVIVSIGIMSTYGTNHDTVMSQRLVANMQQQQRGATYILEREIRAAGFNPTGSATAFPVGVIDARRYAVVAEPTTATPDVNGSPALTLNFDLDGDGVFEQSSYLLYDIDNDGTTDLVRNSGAGYDLLAEGIEALGFAYAIDADLDGKIDSTATGNIIWAVDSDNDNFLDTNLDTNDDGIIDAADDVDGDATIAIADGGVAALPAPVALDRVRAVRFWLLSASLRNAPKAIVDSNTYVVGDRIIGPINDIRRRRSVVVSIRGRNLNRS